MSDGDAVVETIVRAEVIQQFVDQASSLVHETVLHIGKDGIETRAVDPANVAMVDIQIDAAACESVPNGSFAAGIDLEKLDDYLGNASGDDPVSFAFNPEDRTLNLRHTNREFNVAMIDPDSMRGEPDIPNDLELSVDVTLPADEWQDAAEAADLVSDHIYYRSDADAGEINVVGEGDIDDVTVTFDGDHFAEGSEIGDSVEGIYSIGYLLGTGDSSVSGFLKPIPTGDLRVRFGEEFPAKYNYEFAEGHGRVELMCAPRIQNS